MADGSIAYVFDPWGHMVGGWGWVGMTLIMLVFVGLVVWVVATITRSTPGDRRTSALEILEERYARGDIDEEEFRRRRDILTGEGSKR